MIDSQWEDYFEILGINPDASDEELKESYLYKVNLLHPDRLGNINEKIKRRAEEDLKKVNRAYDVLKDPIKRRDYHRKWCEANQEEYTHSGFTYGSPIPIINPSSIDFGLTVPFERKRATVIIENKGGTCEKVLVGQLPAWLKIVNKRRPNIPEKFPLEIDFEAQANEAGRTYSSFLRIKLDEIETGVKFLLRTTGNISETLNSYDNRPEIKIEESRGINWLFLFITAFFIIVIILIVVLNQ